MLHAFYLPIRRSFELTQRAKIKDTTQVILRSQTFDIRIRSIVKVRSTD